MRPPSLVKSMGYYNYCATHTKFNKESLFAFTCLIQLTKSSSNGSEVVDVSVIWSGLGVDPPHMIDTLNDSSGKFTCSLKCGHLFKSQFQYKCGQFSLECCPH